MQSLEQTIKKNNDKSVKKVLDNGENVAIVFSSKKLPKTYKSYDVAAELKNDISCAISGLDLDSLIHLAKIILGLDHPTIIKAKNILSSNYS